MKRERQERDKAQERKRALLLRQARMGITRHSRFGATFVQRDISGRQIAQVAASGIHSRSSSSGGAFAKAPSVSVGRIGKLSSQVSPATNRARDILVHEDVMCFVSLAKGEHLKAKTSVKGTEEGEI